MLPPPRPHHPSSYNRPLLRFFLVIGATYLIWFFGYEQWLAANGRLDTVLCNHVAAASVVFPCTMGFVASLAHPSSNLVLMNAEPAVVVGAPCSGLVLSAIFSGFILAFPGRWQRKAGFIPLGILLIWGLNVLRTGSRAGSQSPLLA